MILSRSQTSGWTCDRYRSVRLQQRLILYREYMALRCLHVDRHRSVRSQRLHRFLSASVIDGLDPNKTSKRYMHHYNFPSYSVGETKPSRGPGRREIGHGALAERALVPVLPSEEEFPYAIRTVSETFESNGFNFSGKYLCIYNVIDGSRCTDQETGCRYFLWIW